MIKTGRAINVVLGSGDSSLPNLLGGTFGAGEDDVTRLAGGFGARFFPSLKDKVLRAAARSSGGGGGGGTRPCVHIASWVIRRGEDGQAEQVQAGHIQVDDQILLIDGTWGRVGYSERREAKLFRVVTAELVSLVCSDSAPLPVRDGGHRTPGELMGHSVLAWPDPNGVSDWRPVADVQAVGFGWVQHLTVGNRDFWAGEHAGRYLGHHNAKPPPES